MRLVLQRVARAVVTVDDELVGQIGLGLLVLVGVERGDGEVQVEKAACKLAELRVFADDGGAMNLNASAVDGDFLLVSNFTLAGCLTKGRRPSFDGAARPEAAQPLVDALAVALRARGFAVPTGRFGAHMEVELVNDGPVTFVLDIPI